MKERVRFQVFRDGEIVAEGTASECARATGLKVQTIRAYACSPKLCGRWSIYVVAPDSAERVAVDILRDLADNKGCMSAARHFAYVKRLAALRK